MATSFTEEYDKTIESVRSFHTRVCKEDNLESAIQKGLLMKEIDPEMYQKIDSVRALLASGSISLLDNFISVSLEAYTNEQIEALLGIKRVPLKHNGMTISLSQLYFDIENQLIITGNKIM